MKLLLFYLMPVALITISCQLRSGDIKNLNDLDAANLKGNVIRVKESYHKVGDVCCPAGDRGECSQKITIYDIKGFTLETSRIGVNGDTINKSVYYYDQRPTCESIENFSGRNLVSREINDVENGLVKSVMVMDNKGILLNTYRFRYSRGLLTRGETINSEGEIVSSIEKKYKDGRMVSETVKDGTEKIFSITKIKRNNHGDLIEETVIHPSDSSEYILRYEYVYDERGNWIKQTKIYNDDIISIKIRDIEYFDDEVLKL